VFSTRLGSPLSADNLRKRQLRQGCGDAGIKPIGWHTFRHTHSSLLHALGIPLKVAQAQLGHSRLSTTLEIYTHAATDDQRGAVAKLEGILDPNGPKFGVSEEPQNEKVLSVQ
ncbi:MAG TPA: tyrosine-type recombinase/integrase, partial [Candidatus Acidoferrales bacterium]|nr:tyrosine-type recombinase/integrase [Candidatus Acidoferrales bacterium]